MSCHIFLSNKNKVVIFFLSFFHPLGTQHAVIDLQHIANKTQEAPKLGSLTIYNDIHFNFSDTGGKRLWKKLPKYLLLMMKDEFVTM